MVGTIAGVMGKKRSDVHSVVRLDFWSDESALCGEEESEADSQTWSRELGKHNIRVNAVAPGFIATEMVQGMPPKVID